MLELTIRQPDQQAIDTLAIPVCEDADIHDSPVIQQLVSRANALEEFSAKSKEQVTFYDPPEAGVRRVIFVGLGKQEDIGARRLRAFAGKVVGKCIAGGLEKLVLAVPTARGVALEPAVVIRSLAEGAVLGNHVFGRYKKSGDKKPLKKIRLLVKPTDLQLYQSLVERITEICRATHLARDWVNIPANDKRPAQLAEILQEAGKKAGLRARVLDELQLEQMGCGAILAVAGGSQSPPRMVVLEHGPEEKEAPTVLLVGKGVTFDSGGLHLKGSQHLAGMKADMAGAAAVAATMTVLPRLDLKLHVVGVMPLVENMPSGTAVRTGDVIRTFSGKTVEVANTDAEGRLILADAISYGLQTYDPEVVIDLATLTGACVVALGERMAAVFSPDRSLEATIHEAGRSTGERCWPMPLPDDYREFLESEIADISNLPSTRYGGAITAALFLREFVGRCRWAHLDIAGPAFARKASDYCGPGGTGFGVRLVCQVLDELNKTFRPSGFTLC